MIKKYTGRMGFFWGKRAEKVDKDIEREKLVDLKSKCHLEIVLLVSLADRCTDPGRDGGTETGAPAHKE